MTHEMSTTLSFHILNVKQFQHFWEFRKEYIDFTAEELQTILSTELTARSVKELKANNIFHQHTDFGTFFLRIKQLKSEWEKGLGKATCVEVTQTE